MTDHQAAEDSIRSQTSGSGRGKRIADLDEVQQSGPDRKLVDPTPDEARALIDRVFRKIGNLAHAACRARLAWWSGSLGSTIWLSGLRFFDYHQWTSNCATSTDGCLS